jgi:predicted Co/Zn/Cd cation transporter (cation efflux family)
VNPSAEPSFAVNLLLTAVFVVVCRWAKRNPSSFLRYTLFPFGGLNVERWPRFMLVAVKVFAAAAFFAFLLGFMNLLAPGSLAHPTPAALYTKFAVAVLISFLP